MWIDTCQDYKYVTQQIVVPIGIEELVMYFHLSHVSTVYMMNGWTGCVWLKLILGEDFGSPLCH